MYGFTGVEIYIVAIITSEENAIVIIILTFYIPSTTSTDLLDGPQYMTHLIFSSLLWDGTNLRLGLLATIKA